MRATLLCHSDLDLQAPHISVVSSSFPVAFSFGRHIMISAEFLELPKEQVSPSTILRQVAFVIGHEMGHHAKGDCFKFINLLLVMPSPQSIP